MTLVPVGQDFQFVGSSTPSGGQSGDWWLDTTNSPPVAKAYDGSSWVKVQTVQRVEDNLDDKVSNAGSSQSELADGADESDGRWMWGYRGPVKEAEETVLTVSGSGAVPTFNRYQAEARSTAVGDTGLITSGGSGKDSDWAQKRSVGALLIKATLGIDRSISDFSDQVFVGMFEESLSDDVTATNVALFAPAQGDQTAGNVRVDSNGTDADGAVNYPTMDNQLHSYTVLIDIDGIYLSAGHTGFYIDSDPRKGDSPDADLAAIPDFESQRVFGWAYKSADPAHRAFCDYLEVGWRP
ncbi:hypothetical protein [Halovenus marina]|uniref:hypothetical protein n=1 Tax=Halovenus marina TaxID=3396621 RepID=UPI003F56FD61